MVTYRVEKDGITFYVQPEMLDYYASRGYKIYKTIEKQVADIAVEIAAIDEPKPVIKEVTVNG